MPQHEYQLAKVGFDIAENEPSNVPYILYFEALFTAQPYMPEVSEMVDKKKSISDAAESQLHNMTEKARFADGSQFKAASLDFGGIMFPLVRLSWTGYAPRP